jgi:hypothetical protein
MREGVALRDTAESGRADVDKWTDRRGSKTKQFLPNASRGVSPRSRSCRGVDRLARTAAPDLEMCVISDFSPETTRD